jgi:hypothetical protein
MGTQPKGIIMSQWAREHPEAMAEIAAAPLHRQNDLLADAARGIAGREARRQREYVERTDREIAADAAPTGCAHCLDRIAGRTTALCPSHGDEWEVGDSADTPAPPIIDRSEGRAQIAAVEQFDAQLADEQLTDRELRERGQQILDRLDHTAEDMMTDLDDLDEDEQ